MPIHANKPWSLRSKRQKQNWKAADSSKQATGNGQQEAKQGLFSFAFAVVYTAVSCADTRGTGARLNNEPRLISAAIAQSAPPLALFYPNMVT
jgi:hypothetical protein